jgi:hypothetical protein
MGVRGKAGSVALIVCATMAVTAATAVAATTEYAPGEQARNFNGGGGGWTASTEHDGLCVPALTCYTAGGRHVANGGPTGAGDGFLRTDLFTIADAVTETEAMLTSPPFVYNGVNGEAPTELTFSLDRRTDLGALLPVINDNATFEVKALQANGSAATLIGSTTLAGAEDQWTSVAPVSLDPKDLELGRTYQIQIASVFQPGIQVIGNGDADYDNVVLQARGGGGGGGGQGNAGTGGGLTAAVKNMIGNADHRGNRIRVRVGCPKFVGETCSLRVVAKLNRTGPAATAAQGLRVKAGKKRFARLRIKQAYKQRIATRNRIVVRVRVKVDGKKRTVIKRVRLSH